MADLNNIISKEVKTSTKSLKVSVTREMAQDLQTQTGLDVEKELERLLEYELNAANFDTFAAGITAQNREGKLNSILEDKEFQPINIEDTEEFKMLWDEYKEKWRKYGRIDYK